MTVGPLRVGAAAIAVGVAAPPALYPATRHPRLGGRTRCLTILPEGYRFAVFPQVDPTRYPGWL